MTDGQIIAITIGAACAILLVLILVVLIRTLAFKPKKVKPVQVDEVAIDKQKIVRDFQEMIRCKTISHSDASLDDQREFDKFERVLRSSFPAITQNCKMEKVTPRSLLYRWQGKTAENPTVLMAHYDVVSVEQSEWSKPAFDAVIEDDVIWGRGTLDTKATLCAIMQAAEKLIGEGFVPASDVYLAFGGNEEVNGNGASAIVEYFKQRGIIPALVLDEGGAVVENVFPGVKKPCALIGIAEKGFLNLQFSCVSGGGHASAPPAHTLVGQLSQVCVDVENNPFKFKLTPPAKSMFDTLGRHSTFLYRMVFANLWLFKPVLNSMGKSSGGELNALFRTTCAFTQMEGSKGANVLPATAKMSANLRIISGETMESTVAYVKGIAKDRVNVSVVDGINPSVVSSVDCEGWSKVCDAVSKTWSDAIISPYLMLACSDSRHYGEITDKVYRFSAMALSKQERALIHGNDERIPVETLINAVKFYVRLIRTL